MKNSFKFLGALTMLIALSIAFFAFKPAQKAEKALHYWQYSGMNSATDQLEYAPATTNSCEGGKNVVCTILAEEDTANPGYPLISGQPVESNIIAKSESAGDVFVRN
jgi:hypothetical protein